MEQDSHVGDPHGALEIVEMMNAVVREQNEYGSWAAKEICDRYCLLSSPSRRAGASKGAIMNTYQPFNKEMANATDRVAWALCQIIDEHATKK